ncbi:MAG: tetratricopeptide repeat protein [bacterium]
MTIIRTQNEIALLKEDIKSLDADGDGHISKTEFYDQNNKIQDKLEEFTRGDFHIITYQDFLYWTEQYQAGTPASFWSPKVELNSLEDDGFDLQAEIEQAYLDGQLLDMALAIEDEPGFVEAMKNLEIAEQEWLTYHEEQKSERQDWSREQSIARIAKHFPKDWWGYFNINPKKYLTDLNLTEKELLDMGGMIDMLEFFHDHKGYEYEANALTTDLFTKNKYDCNIIATAAIHFLEQVGISGFEAILIPQHATLAYQTKSGDHIFFDNANAFLPEDAYYDPEYREQGLSEGTISFIKPWQILSSNILENVSKNATWKDFIIQYKQILEVNQDFNDLGSDLGLILSNLGNKTEAIDYLKQEIKTHPENLTAYLTLGDIYLAAGKFEEANDLYLEAQRIDESKNIDNHDHDRALRVNQIVIHISNSEYEEASTLLNTSFQSYGQTFNPEDMYFFVAEKLRQLGAMELALECYDTAFNIYDEFGFFAVDVCEGIANCLMAIGEYEEAKEIFEIILEKHPESIKAHYGLASYYLYYAPMPDLERAKSYLLKIIEIDEAQVAASEQAPTSERVIHFKDPNVYTLLCSLEMNKGNLDQAKDYCEQALEINPYHLTALSMLSMIHMQTGDLEKAKEYLQTGFDLDPTNVITHYYLAFIFFLTSDKQQSRHYIDMGLAIRPNHPELLDLKAQLLMSEGHLQEATKIYEEIYTPENPNIQMAFGYAYCLMLQGRIEEAKDIYLGLIERQPGNYFIRQQYGMFLLSSTSLYDEARAQFDFVLDRNPNEASTLLSVAQLEMYNGNLETALDIATQALALNNEFSYTHFVLAQIYQKTGDNTQAEEHFRSALDYSPNEATILSGYAFYLHRAGQHDAASIHFDQAKTSNPEDPWLLSSFAFSKLQEGRFFETQISLEALSSINPIDIQGIITQVELAVYRHDFETANRLIEQAKSLQPNNPTVNLTEAFVSYSEDNIGNAIALLKGIEENRPNQSEAISLHALCLIKQEAHADAIVKAEQALAVNPNLDKAHSALFIAYTLSGQKEKASEHLEALMQINPHYQTHLLDLAAMYTDLGKISKAIRIYKDLIKNRPEDVRAYMGLATIYENKGNTKKGMPLYEQILALDPENTHAFRFLQSIH